MKFLQRLKSNTAGLSIVSVLVALGMVGMLAAAVAQMSSTGFMAQKKISLATERDILRSMLWKSTSCESFMPCAAGSWMELKRLKPDGTYAISVSAGSPYTKFGRHSVRARCNAAGDGVVIEALVETTPDTAIDPITKESYTWGDEKSLLAGTGIEMCTGVKSRPSIVACVNNCGGDYPIQVGGWRDTNDIDDIAFDSGCSGVLANRGDGNEYTYFCAQASPPPFVLCINSCGGDYPIMMGGWRDTNDIDDIAYDTGCSGSLSNRGDGAANTLLCARGP